MDTVTIGLAILGLGATAAAALYLLARVSKAERVEEPAEFDAEAYAPMRRLLAEDDFVFLRSQPGFDPAIEARLRKQRRAIYRSYLRRLAGDFRALHLALRELILAAPDDQQSLLSELAKQNFYFQTGLWRVRAALWLHGLGLTVSPDPAGRLVEAVRRMRELAVSFSVPQPGAAA